MSYTGADPYVVVSAELMALSDPKHGGVCFQIEALLDEAAAKNLVHHFYDGVRVEAEAGPCLYQKVTKTFVACPELKLDLSGLRVQRDATWSALNERLLSFVQEIANKGSWIVKA